jgi:hypothetical protein
MYAPFRRHGRGRAGLASLVALLLLSFAADSASALVRVPAHPAAVSGNPANALAGLSIELPAYDRATRCTKTPRPGMTALVSWLGRNARGTSWGTYRCERWGKGSASLHAEGRAVDWALNRANPADARAAKELILLLLAPDRAGNPQALARRMGVQEIIWDCGYWGAGMTSFKKYGACYSESGRARKRVGATIAHRDHMHIGLSKAGAARKTSFWTRRAPRPQDQAGAPERPRGEDEDSDDDRGRGHWHDDPAEVAGELTDPDSSDPAEDPFADDPDADV